ncbi:MAG: hypothetical protein HYT93_05050 [Parcubacteria group bacterium]|nr:hypothetical protein [Parcubacteria group bacterium]
MTEVIPALMPRSFSELRESIEKFIGIVPLVQLDVMDGVFVPEKSWPYSENKNELQELINGHDTIPFWEDIDFEVDLMIENPEQEIKNWILFGASRIIVHVESVRHMDFIIEEVQGSIAGKQEEDGHEKKIEIGLAVNIDTPNKMIEPFIRSVDFIQCMGIAKIGYQGQLFDERVIHKIEDLRERYPDVTISVDGGVNFESAPKLTAVGANRLVSGSTILKSKDIEEAISLLQNA